MNNETQTFICIRESLDKLFHQGNQEPKDRKTILMILTIEKQKD